MLLGKNKINFENELKEKFITNYIIIHATDFKAQFRKVIESIKNIFNVCEDLAYIYYGAIRNQIQNIIVENPLEEIKKRQISLSELKTNIVNNKSIIFYSTFSEFLGEEKYFKFIKNKFPKIDYTYNNYLFIGENIKESTIYSFAQVIKYIIDKYFKKNIADSKPFNMIFEDSNNLKKIKSELVKLDIKFNDGYEDYWFSEKIFKNAPLIKKLPKTEQESSFDVRLISFETFKQIKNPIIPDRIYIFGNNFSISKLFNIEVKFLAINELLIDKMFELL